MALVGTVTTPTGAKPGLISVDPTALDFGSTDVGTTSASKPVTVRNKGTGELTVRGASLQGVRPDDYTMDAGRCTDRALRAGQTCTVDVRFAPTAAGERGAILQVDADPGSTSLILTGRGVGPGPGPVITGIQVEPGVLAFGGQKVKTTSAVRDITLSNRGSESATVAAVQLTGAQAGDFKVVSDGCGGMSLAPSRTCAVSVMFAPSVTGERSATVEIGRQKVAVSGRGTQAVLSAETGLQFGDHPVSKTNLGKATATVKNTGTADAVVTAVSVAGDPAFSMASNTCSTLPPGSSCVVEAEFTPTPAGPHSAAMTIVHDAGQPLVLKLSGTAIAPPPASADVRVDIKQPVSPYSATITNDGPATATAVVFKATIVGGAWGTVDNSQGTCSVTGSQLTCFLGSLPNGGSATVSAPAPGGTTAINATVTAAEQDLDTKNNSAGLSVPP